MPVITGMKGAGYYDQYSAVQLSSIQALLDWMNDAAATLPLPDAGQPVTVPDLGSSEGGNAVRVMAAVVAGLRRRPVLYGPPRIRLADQRPDLEKLWHVTLPHGKLAATRLTNAPPFAGVPPCPKAR
jgi:hypothetical protein